MRLALGLLLGLGACGGSSATPDAVVCAPDAGPKTFGETCASPCECASQVCFTFGDGTQACTLACSSSTQCPSGSQGQKCNNQGVCRP